MPDEDKNFGGSLVLDFRKWWRYVKTIYTLKGTARAPTVDLLTLNVLRDTKTTFNP